MLYPVCSKDRILGVERNNFIKHVRLADEYAGTNSVPMRRIQKIKSIYEILSQVQPSRPLLMIVFIVIAVGRDATKTASIT